MSHYMAHWGMPEYRVIFESNDKAEYVEIYFFPDTTRDVIRFATVGLSNCIRPTGERVGFELMIPLLSNLGGEERTRIFDYVADLIAHHVANVKAHKPPAIMGESKLAPEKWNAKAFLVDELRGESEDLEVIAVGDEKVEVLWGIPITRFEYDLISKDGIEAFDKYVDQMDASIIDPTRS